MIGLRFVLPVVAACAAMISAPASAETRAAYLERLREICAVECKEPREALRSARRNGRGATDDVALILDVEDVSLWNGNYLILAATGNSVANPAVGGNTPLNARPIVRVNQIVVELDEDTFFSLLNVPTPDEQAAMRQGTESGNGEIVVGRDRRRNFTRPTLGALRTTFRNRRIVVRGQPRLEAVFIGARLDHLRKKLFIAVDNARHVAFLPRYDADGEPIFDGPLEALRDDYSAAEG